MAIYIDVIWFLNFCIDFLLLLLTSLFLKRDLVKRRLVLGALVAASSVFLLVTPMSGLYYHPFFKLLFSSFIIIIAYGFKRFSYFIQNVFTFYFVSFICGGGLIALHYFFNSEMVILNGLVTTKSSGFGTPISWFFVFFGFPAIWFFAKKRVEHIQFRKLNFEQIVLVEISVFDLHLDLKGLIDSGNQLQDPLTNRPVMIIDMNELQGEFPTALVQLAKFPEQIGNPKLLPIDEKWQERLCIIPYRGVGQKNQFIIGIKPDRVVLTLEANEKLECRNVIIGLNFTNLSSAGDFQCILHPQMLTQGKKRLA